MKKRGYQIVTALLVTTLALPAVSKVTLDDVYAADAPKRARDLANNAAYMARHSGPLIPRVGDTSQPENLVYVGSGNKRLTETGYYVVDTSASGNRTTSSIYVPSLSGTYYGTSGTSSNSAVGVRVVNGVLRGYGNQSTPSITGIYKLK